MVVPIDSEKRSKVLTLIAEKDTIENKIKEHGKVLSTNMIGFSESLVDDSGFPRNDIDVYQVRHARHQIICLQNDLKILMKKIETGIQEIHAEFPATEPSGASASTAEHTTRFVQFTEKPERIIPIAKVNLVSQGSPAEFCGIRLGDEILSVGSVSSENFKDLTQIGEVIRHRKDQSIEVIVNRDNKVIHLDLVPKIWSGRGLLGCNIVVMEAEIER